MDDLQLNDASSKIVVNTIATTASLNDQWDQILITKFNSSIVPYVHNRTWLEIAFLGAYTLLQRTQTAFSAEDYEKISAEVRNGLLRMIMTVVFDEQDAEKRKSLEEVIKTQLDKSFELYKNHTGDTALILRDRIRDIFNASEEAKIKFVENNWKTRWGLGFALGFPDVQSKYKGTQFINTDFLLTVAQTIASEFRNLDSREFIEPLT